MNYQPSNREMHTDQNNMEMGRQDMQGMSRLRTTSDASNVGDDLKNKGSMESTETDFKPVDWKKVFFTPKYIPLWILTIVITILTVILSIKHDQVVAKLRPFAEKTRDIPAGWLIFIAILFVISFPPLFGHELVALLAGVVYGLWIGFAVVAAGTFIGEIGTWFAFKTFFRKKAEKMERTNLTYAAMARLCRDGGFWIVLVIRFSVIPSHMSTAVFSTCDVKFWHFAVSTFITLPKQLILVYLGVLLVEEQDDAFVKNALFALAGLVTIIAGAWIWYKMRAIKKALVFAQEQRRLRAAQETSYNNLQTEEETVSLQPNRYENPHTGYSTYNNYNNNGDVGLAYTEEPYPYETKPRNLV